MIELEGLESVLESIRWTAVAALRHASNGDHRPDILMAQVAHACITPWEDSSRHLFNHILQDARELFSPGPLTIRELLELLDGIVYRKASMPAEAFPMVLSPDRSEWILEVCTDGVLTTSDLDMLELTRWGLFYLIKSYIHDDTQSWEGRLSSGDGDLAVTYAALSDCFVTAVALARHTIPPWIPEDSLTTTVRSSWGGAEEFERARSETMRTIGFGPAETVPVELPDGSGVWLSGEADGGVATRRRVLVIEEMHRRGWGDDPQTLTLEQGVDLLNALCEDQSWIGA